MKNTVNVPKLSKGYSPLQYFFWLISGAEISVLKKCPTDFNRQAGIGFTIFMTTLLAFLSGGYAGWYFGESYLTAFLFGILWSMLVFSIDRSMVVTMKKNPAEPKQNFWLVFIPRVFLAILIAFIISIPLELLIFNENIELHMDKYKLDQVQEIQQKAIRNNQLVLHERNYSRDSIMLNKTQADLQQGEPQSDPEYNQLKANYQFLQKEYDALLNNLNNAINFRNRAYNNLPVFNGVRDTDNSNYIRLRDIAREKQNAYNAFGKDKLLKAKQAKEDYVKTWAEGLKTTEREIAASLSNTTKHISDGIARTDTITKDYGRKIENKKGFVMRFMILEDLATFSSSNHEGRTIFNLLWLIRAIFFIVEILPAVVKIATPIGAYDIAVAKQEEDFTEELEQNTTIYLNHQERLRRIEYDATEDELEGRKKEERLLHDNLVREIAAVQNLIGMKKIEEFKKQHLNGKV